MTRSSGILAAFLAAQFLVGACARGNSQPKVDAGSTETALLPRAAYLLALDSTLVRLGAGGKRVFISSADSHLPFTAEDLRARKVKSREDTCVRAGEAALWFLAPQRQDNGHIRLDVVEATDQSGMAGGRSYIFRCTTGSCRLEDTAQLNSDYLVGCRASMMSSPIPIPAA